MRLVVEGEVCGVEFPVWPVKLSLYGKSLLEISAMAGADEILVLLAWLSNQLRDNPEILRRLRAC